MKFIITVIIFIISISSVFAFNTNAQEGNTCNFQSEGDEKCNPGANLYCIEGTCKSYPSNEFIYCLDSDGNDITKKSSVSFKYRRWDSGAIIQNAKEDACYKLGTDASSGCSGTDCYVEEFTCKLDFQSNPTDAPWQSNQVKCNSCSNGICLDSLTPVKECQGPISTKLNIQEKVEITSNNSNEKERYIDTCYKDGFGVASCSGNNCEIKEYYCSQGSYNQVHQSKNTKCNSCSNGTCVEENNTRICAGPESPNAKVQEKVEMNNNGERQIYTDNCYKDGFETESCSGTRCEIKEYYCDNERKNYLISAKPCISCSFGSCTNATRTCTDNDGDGFSIDYDCGTKDCDDTNPNIRPDNLGQIIGGCGAGGCENVHIKEICNDNKDNDCDGKIDMRDEECKDSENCTTTNGNIQSDIPITLSANQANTRCANNEFKCNIETKELVMCENNQWMQNDMYEIFCNINKECNPGELSCDTENDQYRLCNGFGVLVGPFRDDYTEVCESMACSENKFQCNNANKNIKFCNDGTWSDYTSEGYEENCLLEEKEDKRKSFLDKIKDWLF